MLSLSPLAVTAAEAGGRVELMVHDRAKRRQGLLLLLPDDSLCRWPMVRMAWSMAMAGRKLSRCEGCTAALGSTNP